MAVLKMQKINLCAMKKNRKRILEEQLAGRDGRFSENGYFCTKVTV